jgi:hypothetical protein
MTGQMMEQTELIQANIEDLLMGSLGSLEVTLDLGPLSLASQVNEGFDDLIRRKCHASGNLFPLKKCRHLLREGGTLRLRNTCTEATGDSYAALLSILLGVAGFTDMKVIDHTCPMRVEATRRPGIVEEQEYGMVVRELISPEEIATAHEFARGYYFYKDFNYDFEVARQFDLHTDTFAVYDKANLMVALARVALHAPGYNCPFMYAVTDVGEHVEIPGRHRRFGEVMAIYKEGREGVFGYKRLMEFLVHHVPLVAFPDSIWTTYEENDPFTGNLYKNKFMMEDTGVRLTYRDFGGKWNLLCTEKIQELHTLHRNLFRK